jgi:hypothetical protein
VRHEARSGALVKRAVVSVGVLVALLSGVASAQMPPGMPDARQMSGVPLPVPDLAPGTVTVRVVRGTITNIIPNQDVELTGGPSVMKAKTNDAGRAEFTGLAPGTRVKASTTVNGERLESQEFAVPASGGTRVALVATDPAQKNAQPAAQPGSVVFGPQTRFVFEMGDEVLNVFMLLEVLNGASTAVQPPQPVVVNLPADSQGAGVMEGSAPNGVVQGKHLVINGPFAPGSTLVQAGFALPIDGASLTWEQRFPVALEQLSVMAQKVGDMQLQSPQIADHRDMPVQGEMFIVAKGRGIPAGQPLSLTLTGLPHHATWPRNLALALAIAILGAGGWVSARAARRTPEDQARRKRLDARRERLFGELAAVEQQHRDRTIDAERYAARRKELVAALERVYAELDGEAAA